MEIRADKSAAQTTDRLCLSLNFLGCLVLGPVNFVVYKIMYNSFGEGRAFFVSQVRRMQHRLNFCSCIDGVVTNNLWSTVLSATSLSRGSTSSMCCTEVSFCGCSMRVERYPRR